MDVALVTAAVATRDHGLSRAGAYRNAKVLSDRLGERLLVVDGRAVTDPEELVSLLAALSARAERAEAELAAAEARNRELEADLQLSTHEQELERDRSARSLTALSEIIDRASTLMREQVSRVNDLR